MPMEAPVSQLIPETFITRARTRWLGTLSGYVLATLLVTLPVDAGLVESPFSRGDVNQDDTLDIADPIAALGFLFSGNPIECEDAADANDDGTINIADAVTLLNYLFVDPSQVLPMPFGVIGVDPTADLMGCNTVECLDAAEVSAGLSILSGTFPLPGAVPAQTITQSGVTVDIMTADAELTVGAVVYDPLTHTFTATGTAGAPAVPVTITAFLINVSCDVAISADWSLSGTLETLPFAPGASEVIGVLPGSVMATVTNPTVDFSLCPGLGLISGVLNTLFATAIQDAIDPILMGLEVQVSDAVDALIGTTPLYVCD